MGVLKGTFICVAKKIDNWLIQCASHTQYAEHALSRVSGACPNRKIWLAEIEFDSNFEFKNA